VQARDVAQRRATEAAEAMEAGAFTKQDEDEEGGHDQVATGVQRTKLEGVQKIVQSELEDLRAKMQKESIDLQAAIMQFFKDDAEASERLEKGPGLMTDELDAALDFAKKYLCATMEPRIAAWKQECGKAKSGRQLVSLGKEAVEIKKDFKADRVKAYFSLVGSTKKFLSTERKKQTTLAKRAKDGTPTTTVAPPAAPTVAVLIAMIDRLKESGGIEGYCSKSIFEARAGIKACKLQPLGRATPDQDIMKANYVKRALKGTKSHMQVSGSTSSHHVFMQASPDGKKINKVLNKAIDGNARTKMVLPDQDHFNKVFSPDLLVETQNSVLIMPTNYCMTEARLIFEEGSIVMGTPWGMLKGHTAEEKRVAYLQMTVDDAIALLEHGSWVVKAEVGDVLVIPSGHLIVSASPTGCTYLRWCVGGDNVDCSRAREMLSHMMVAFPELKAAQHGYLQLHEFLADQGF